MAQNSRVLEDHSKLDGPRDVRPPSRLILLLFMAIVLLVIIDAVSDFRETGATTHVAGELAVALLALIGTGLVGVRLLRDLRTGQDRERELHLQLQTANARATAWQVEATNWRAKVGHWTHGLAIAIDEQFVRWSLTAAEKEVALLLLKGLPTSEIASVRGTSERTVRQQAQCVYRKAGLSGRADLAAFFLEDLLMPGEPSAGVKPALKDNA